MTAAARSLALWLLPCALGIPLPLPAGSPLGLNASAAEPDPVPYQPGQFGTFGDMCHQSGSSKCTKYFHAGYQRFYPEFLDPIREQSLKFCEIGLKDGESYNLWRPYLPKAELHGIEISATEEVKAQAAAKGLTLHVGDQEDKTFLQQFVADSGGAFDVIVDDGGHAWAQQINTFDELFPKALKQGGLFVVEDVETSYWKPDESLYGTPIKGKAPSSQSLVGYLVSLVDAIGTRDIVSISAAENVFFVRKAGEGVYPNDNLGEVCATNTQSPVCKHQKDVSLLVGNMRGGATPLKVLDPTAGGPQLWNQYIQANAAVAPSSAADTFDVVVDEATTANKFTQLLQSTADGGILIMLQPAPELVNQMKQMVSVVNRKFNDNQLIAFSEEDRKVKYVGFAKDMLMVRKRVQADNLFNQPYVWKGKLKGPAATQDVVP